MVGTTDSREEPSFTPRERSEEGGTDNLLLVVHSGAKNLPIVQSSRILSKSSKPLLDCFTCLLALTPSITNLPLHRFNVGEARFACRMDKPTTSYPETFTLGVHVPEVRLRTSSGFYRVYGGCLMGSIHPYTFCLKAAWF